MEALVVVLVVLVVVVAVVTTWLVTEAWTTRRQMAAVAKAGELLLEVSKKLATDVGQLDDGQDVLCGDLGDAEADLKDLMFAVEKLADHTGLDHEAMWPAGADGGTATGEPEAPATIPIKPCVGGYKDCAGGCAGECYPKAADTPKAGA